MQVTFRYKMLFKRKLVARKELATKHSGGWSDLYPLIGPHRAGKWRVLAR